MKSSKILALSVSFFLCFLKYCVMVMDSKLSHSGGGLGRVLSDEADSCLQRCKKAKTKRKTGRMCGGCLGPQDLCLGAPVGEIQIGDTDKSTVWKRRFPLSDLL